MLDGFVIHQLATQWHAAGTERETITALGEAVVAMDMGLLAVATLLLFGVGLGLYGLALATSPGHVSWLGWLGTAIGATGLVAGSALALVGATDVTLNLMVRPVLALGTAYLILVGVLVWRRTPADEASQPSPSDVEQARATGTRRE